MFHRACRLEDGSADASHHALALQPRLGQVALDNHFAQNLLSRDERHGADIVTAVGVNGLVAHEREAQQAARLGRFERERTVIAGHDTRYERRVGQREGHNISVRQRLSLVVNHPSGHGLSRKSHRHERQSASGKKS